MTTRQVFDCDGCGKKELSNPVHIAVVNGSQYCPMDGTQDILESRDLCPVCAKIAIERACLKNLEVTKKVLAGIDCR